MANNQIDVKKLKTITNKNDTSLAVMMNLATRERAYEFSDINRTKAMLKREGEKIEDKDYNQLWKDLQDLSLGKVVGGKGKAPKFQWFYSLKTVGQLAMDGKVSFKPADTPVIDTPTTNKTLLQYKMVVIPIRDNLNVNFQLPTDLTPEESSRVKRIIAENI